MAQSNHGITKTKGEEQPADKDRAQTAQRTGAGKTSPSKEETGKEARIRPGPGTDSTAE